MSDEKLNEIKEILHQLQILSEDKTLSDFIFRELCKLALTAIFKEESYDG